MQNIINAPKAEYKLVTPEMASEWLKRVDPEHQRKLQPSVVNNYAAIMKSGGWTLNHQGIAFDQSGRLMDGQHRLHGCVESGVSIPLLITRGWKDNGVRIMDTIDQGSGRTIAQSFQVTFQMQNANWRAAMTRVIVNIACRWNAPRGSSEMARQVHEWFEPEINALVLLGKNHRTVTPAYVAGVLAFCLRPMKTELRPFVEQVVTGEEIPKGGVAGVLRNELLSVEDKPKRIIPLHVGSAAMHFVEGTTPKFFRDTELGLDFFRVKQPQVVRKIRELYGLSSER